MTGGEAEASNQLGAPHSAWDGYITGKNLELGPGTRIVQTWRTSRFAVDDPDSTITVALDAREDRDQVDADAQWRARRTDDLPERGWRDHYFEPMRAYFAAQRASEKS